MMRLERALLAAAAAFAVSLPAAADVETSRRTEDGDYHVFKDDLLSSDVAFPSGGNIRVRPGPKRVMFLRPRATFVPEMLKSVEKM